MEQKTCRTCGRKLIIRETQKKASQLQKAYYYTAYYYCSNCQKIYHDDKFKVTREAIHPERPANKRGVEGSLSMFETSNNKNEIVEAEIWTDGACVFNGRHNARAAWAFVSHSTSSVQAGKFESAGLVDGPKQTNNVAEGLAILKALEWAVSQRFKNIKVYTDSQISLYNLIKPSSKVKINKEIFQQIEELIKKNNLMVKYVKVLGHSGDINNSRADKLANDLAAGAV